MIYRKNKKRIFVATCTGGISFKLHNLSLEKVNLGFLNFLIKITMTIDGIILVRSSSSRLKNKCFLEFGDVNIIEHIIKRCKKSKIKPIICTTRSKKKIKN